MNEWAYELDEGQVTTTVTSGRAFVELANMGLAVIGPFEFVHAGKDAGGEHRRRKASAFLVGPVGDHDRVLGCRGVSRADFRLDPSQAGEAGLYLLEVNTQPGMTPLSLVPEQAAYRGIDFGDLVVRLVEWARCDM